MRLAEPGWLALVMLAPLPWLAGRMGPRIAWPTFGGFSAAGRWTRGGGWKGQVSALLEGLALSFAAVAMARPQEAGGRIRVAGKGVAIVLVLDHSSSMNATDPKARGGPRSRLEAAKSAVSRFIVKRADDLVGLVVFANYPDLVFPPRLDQGPLLEAVAALRPAFPGDDGTNLGDAIALALDALRDTTPRRKVLVLLTDGHNSPAVPHPLDPVAAARIGSGLGVTLHTIAIGSARPVAPAGGEAAREATRDAADAPDLPLLRRIAAAGNGRAFVVEDEPGLDAVFRAIDALEKSPVRSTIRTRYHERYPPWLAIAIGCLALDCWLITGPLRRLP